MDFENEIDLNELSERINNLRNLEDQESNPELPDEYCNMDKETIIRMLLASQAENKKLHEKLDKQTEKLDRQDEEARAREERLNKRIDELTRINTRASENQIQMMDKLAELQRQTKQMNDQHTELLTELKRLKDLNRQSRKDKYNTTKQNVKKEKKDEDDHDDEQRGNRVRQKDDFNGDPETLKDACNGIAQSKISDPKSKEERKYRQGMKYNKEISTKVYHHNCDESKLPEGSIILDRETRMLKSIKLSMSVHEYDFVNVKYPNGHMDWVYMPEDIEKIQSVDDDIVDIEYIYGLAHVRSKFVTAYNIGKVRQAKPFLKWIGKLYKLEKEYKNLGLAPEQIKDRRNDEETSRIIQEMQAELDRLWSKDKIKQSEHDPVFATALRYLYNQWEGLMNYRNDGEYSIDNNITERNVRPATVERKNSLSFASEGGIECSTTYHTVIQTCRMMGIKVLNYLQTFFEKFNEGCRDFDKMIPVHLVIN